MEKSTHFKLLLKNIFLIRASFWAPNNFVKLMKGAKIKIQRSGEKKPFNPCGEAEKMLFHGQESGQIIRCALQQEQFYACMLLLTCNAAGL